MIHKQTEPPATRCTGEAVPTGEGVKATPSVPNSLHQRGGERVAPRSEQP